MKKAIRDARNKGTHSTATLLKHAVAALSALLLSGCISTGNMAPPPVEDRSGAGTVPSGSVVDIDRNGSGAAVTTAVATDSGFTVVSQESQAAAPVTEPVTTQVATPEPVVQRNPAVVALLDSAQQQQRSGAYSSAQSSLERAQRIAPRDPQVYYQLADLRRTQGQYLQAEQLALKGVAVAQGQKAMQRKLWLLIADIRSEGGDSAGARTAKQKAGSL